MFKVLLQEILGNRTRIRGISDLLKYINKNEDFLEYVYFRYDFSEYRNKIAHGDIICVNKKFACEIIMDIYWIIKKIDSEELEYKRILLFLNGFASKQSLEQKVEYLESCSNSIESKENLILLKKYFEGDFNEILEWYMFKEQEKIFKEYISSEKLYLLIWNNEPTKIKRIETLSMQDGTKRKCTIVENNKYPIKYYNLLKLFNQYNYVPAEWYKKYLLFIDEIGGVEESEEND